MMRFLLPVATLLAAASAGAQYTWERLPGPDGTWMIQCVHVDPATDDIYAGTPSGGGLFVSTDGGTSWTTRSNGLPVNSAVNDIVVTGGAAYAAVDRIYKSTDGGASWGLLAASPAGMTNLHATSGGEIFAGSEVAAGGKGIYKSTDAGATWTLSAAGIPTYVAGITYYRSVSAVTSDGSGNVFCSVNSGNASTEAGVYVSTDGGANWTRSSSGLFANANVRAVSRSSNGRLYVGVRGQVYSSTNNGANWVRGDSMPNSNFVIVNGITSNGSNEVFAATTNGLYRGAEGGVSWVKLGPSTLPNWTSDVDIQPAVGTIFAGGNDITGTLGGFSRSTDNGDNWALSVSGMNDGSCQALSVTPSGRIFSGLGGGGRVEYSSDAGATWTRVFLPYTGQFILAMVGTIGGNANGAVVGGTAEGMFTSSDEGANWTKTSTAATRHVTTDPSQNFYAATGAGVLRSTDDGQTWTGMGGGGDSYNVFYTAAGTILSGTYNNGVERTTNGGANWTNSGTALFGAVTIGRFVQLPNGVIYVHTLLSMARSTDDGASWSAVTTVPIGVQERTLAAAGGTLLLGSPEGLFVSTDGAQTWIRYQDGLFYTVLDRLALAPDGRLYGSGGIGIYRTLQTILTSVDPVADVRPLEFSLRGNYPNPFNPTTTIEFDLPAASDVAVRIYNSLGQEVGTIMNSTLEAGRYRAVWEAAGSPTGVYFYEVRATAREGSRSWNTTGKMMLLK